MKKAGLSSRWNLIVALVCAGIFAVMAAWAQDGGVQEKKIPIDKVPPAARAAILEAVGDGRIVDVGEITENGRLVRYEVECIRAGREVDIIVTADGKLLGLQDEDNTDESQPAAIEVVAGKLTPKAAALIHEKWPEAAVLEIDVETVDGVDLHKVTLIKGGKELEIEIAPDGTLVSTQTDVDQGDLPSQVRSAMSKVIAEGTLIGIEKEVILATVEKGRVVPLAAEFVMYEAKFSRDGAVHEATLASDGSPARKPGPWRTDFDLEKKNLVTVGRNPYVILKPGRKIHLADDEEYLVITVLDETREVDGVQTRIVEERESKEGKLVEISRNFFAIDKTTNDVYYFGEDVDIYDEDGKIIGHGGAWLSGVDGARFGLIMPGKPMVGDRYYQEFAPDVAMDRAEVVQLNATLKSPMKTFAGCLYVRESSDLEDGYSHKWYASGVGMIGDDDLRIVKIEEPGPGSGGQ